jgi:H+/Cl- antiporter ClcA
MIGSTVIASGLVFALAPWLPGQFASLLPTAAAPGTQLAGAGGPITSHSPAFALLLSVVVLFASALTVGGGMAGGFTTPSIAAGAFLGLAAAGFLGLQPGDPLLIAAVVAGIGGLLSSSANVPIATAVLITEVLGPGYGVVSALATTIGFQINRHHMIYDYIIEDLDTED